MNVGSNRNDERSGLELVCQYSRVAFEPNKNARIQRRFEKIRSTLQAARAVVVIPEVEMSVAAPPRAFVEAGLSAPGPKRFLAATSCRLLRCDRAWILLPADITVDKEAETRLVAKKRPGR